MRCSKAREYLSQHLDDQLPPAETGDLTRHLDGCETCREYREDLNIGRRLLAATEPQLPENFDWKLQLRLNQTLREAAGEAVLPWQETDRRDRWAFLRGFGTATAAGLAAVLTVALLVGPQGAPPAGDAGPGQPLVASGTRWDAADRLPLYLSQPRGSAFARTGGGAGHAVSDLVAGSGWEPPGGVWSTRSSIDTKELQRLRFENRRLRSFLAQYRQQVQTLQTRLDTVDAHPLDLEESP